MIFPRVKSILRHEGFALNTRPYELNLVGIRSGNVSPNRFDDEIHVFYKSKPFKWEYHIFKATTDPGTFWLENPLQPQGTAILAQGQYVNAYQIGMHLGQYKALVQVAPVKIMRDYNRNAKLDFLNGKKEEGLFGINIHRAFSEGKTKYINKYSAGCQVFADANDFNFFMELCERHAKLYGNRFTYALLDFRAMRRESLKRIAAGTLTLGIGLITYYYYNTND
ncbi:MAG: hypothetical protein HY063_10935 [Bacteroidetes bacterium]|nr:hypothetical protein [Bacteroidota bacterium]